MKTNLLECLCIYYDISLVNDLENFLILGKILRKITTVSEVVIAM